MHLVCSFILKVQVIQLFPISFVLPRFLPIYKLIPHSIQFFQNLSSQSFPNHHDHVTSNFHPCNPHLIKKLFLFINNPQYFQSSKIPISDFIVESFFSQQFHAIPIFSLGPSHMANIPTPKR